ncbi:hypothetical protein [Novosphingobium sp. KA1]|uniref:hypothetical protein n=1 Tax=Novosphingobium sp. (strain KA1) TaxID=164608 RepID=UPI001A8E9BB0|nr:hypothetical protein [Novosphingobium sp. KA1]QSR16050.1 hypothetical protein CA833_02365 [Novosphingobium sp. KA1]
MGKAKTRRIRERAKEPTHLQSPAYRRWAERHPRQARDEEQLQRYNASTKKNWAHRTSGTPETHAKAAATRQGAVARLFETGDIDAFQLSAAVSIAATHARITGDVTVSTVSFETRVDQSGRADASFFEKLGTVRAEVAYTNWRRRIEHQALVFAILIDDVGISIAAKRFGMRNARAKKILIDALDLWEQFSIEACKSIDDATLLAAQAGIL